MYDLESLVADPEFMEEFRESLDPSIPPPLIRGAKIKITSRCNLHCRMCKYWLTRSEETLPTNRWRDVLSQLAGLGCRKVHFSGGEVFLRPDFLDLVEHSVAARLKTNMTTNGTLVNKERAKRIVAAGVNSVSISLDGPGPRVHDAIREHPGAFKKAVRAIGLINRFSETAKRKVKLRINFVLMRTNYRELPEMVRLAGELGAIELNAMPVDEKGERKNRLSRRQIEEYNREVAPEVLALRREHGFSTAPEMVYPFGVTPKEIKYSKRGEYARGFYEKRTCLAPWLHIFAAWNGDVFLCCMTNGRMEPFGNVGRTPVREIFHGEGYRRVRAAFVEGEHRPECQRCDMFLRENARLHAAIRA